MSYHTRLQIALGTLTGRTGWLFSALILLAGCGGGSSLNRNPTPLPTPASAELMGKLLGGQYPVAGSEVQLYATGASGYGAGAKALLSPAVTTDKSGNFIIPYGSYTCPSSDALTYLVATGGDPGVGSNNSAIALMATVGPCGDIADLPSITVNEITTVASVWALSPFLGYGGKVGTSAHNAQGLLNAFANVNNLIDPSQGKAPGTSAPAGAIIPVSKINTLANILASCVNSGGATECDALFAQATPSGGTTPSNTLDAALNIARNPARNVAKLFALPTPSSPFQPSLGIKPPDWLIGLTFSGGGLNYPAAIAVDAQGNVWAANVCGSDSPCSSVSEFSSTGEPLSPAGGFTDGTFWESYGLAIDIHGNVWVTNEQTASGNSGRGKVVLLDSTGKVISPDGGYFGGGLDFPFAVATDSSGNVWTANLGDSSATKLANNGSVISGSAGFGAGSLAGPVAVAIGTRGNVWFANQSANSGSVTSISNAGTIVKNFASGGDETSGVAADEITSTNIIGHIWTANFGSSTVSELELDSSGSAMVVSRGYSGGGLNHPNGIAVDGAGNLWVTNYDSATQTSGATISELKGAKDASPGAALSPATGFGADAGLLKPYGIAIDASGNVWVSSFGSSKVTQFLGAATQVKTPLVGPAQRP